MLTYVKLAASMKTLFIIIISLLLIAPSAYAKPLEGFHEGPYLAVEFGAIEANFDHDLQSGESVGSEVERSFGILFGWNVYDELAFEIKGQYATNRNNGQREHIVNANLSSRYSFIFDTLTDFKSLRILPFVKGGVSARLSALPGNPNASDRVVSSYGVGPSVGAGVSFLWKKYLYFGLDFQHDLLFYQDVRQNLDRLNPAQNNQLIYKGGFNPSWNVAFMLGVHY